MADERCLECGGRLVEILWGMPMPEAYEAARRGELVLGGCVVTDDDPAWQCSECGGRRSNSSTEAAEGQG